MWNCANPQIEKGNEKERIYLKWEMDILALLSTLQNHDIVYDMFSILKFLKAVLGREKKNNMGRKN